MHQSGNYRSFILSRPSQNQDTEETGTQKHQAAGQRRQAPQKPISSIIEAGSEIKYVGIAAIAAIAEGQAPEAVIDDGVAIAVRESAQRRHHR